jgi:hypothetical protein
MDNFEGQAMLKWMVSLIRCRGRHQCMMHFLGNDKAWECLRCGRFFEIPEALTLPSGAFAPAAKGYSQALLSGERDVKKPVHTVHDMSQYKARKKGA